ncbi:MAG TPA: hypothetical protein EYQ50_04890 [Verrucomicrobiales bacterium]|nr:hypothetical protein [Verrucomicrobiales bacterium]
MTPNHSHIDRQYLTDPLFDPEKGTTILEPKAFEKGYWVGAPSVAYDKTADKFFMCYRIREPRPVRGGRCHIAESNDGLKFTTIWETTKEDLNSQSIEKSSLIKTPAGGWRLYISYVDPTDNRWRVDLMEADHPANFKISERQKILTASDIQAEGVKDPYAFIVDGKWYLLLSYAPSPDKPSTEETGAMHTTADIYNTGITKSSSGLAVSDDGIHFKWLGDVFSPQDAGWDQYASRLGSLIHRSPLFIGFYDGSSDVSENYEERTGLAVSSDLRKWFRLSPEKPYLESLHQTKSLRYLDPVDLETETRFYYEYSRPDGSHELRMNSISR